MRKLYYARECPYYYKVYIYTDKSELQLLIKISVTYFQMV